MDIRIDCSKGTLEKEEYEALKPRVDEILESLWKGEKDYTGWVSLPLEFAKEDSDFMEEVERIETLALAIQSRCKLFVVVGIGGSYLGARAAIEALGIKPGYPEIRYAGNNLSGTQHQKLLEEVYEKETCICVISKSGTTIEPRLAFSILKEALVNKYGEAEAAKRIFAVTDEEEGVLCQECRSKDYLHFSIPKNIGGRYSVLTAVGLLPMAVVGIPVKQILLGAYEVACDSGWDHALPDYAILRYLMLQKGKEIEIFESYEPLFQYFTEWLKQLFGESEGKDDTGLFPASLGFTTDLHSMGQFLQEGSPIFFETILDLENPPGDVLLPSEEDPSMAGKTMNQINRAALQGVMNAHQQRGVPMVKINIPQMSPRILGQLFYFFQTTCAITASLMGVNPFNQPGVEAYKAEMKKELEK